MLDKFKNFMDKISWQHVAGIVVASAVLFYFMLDTAPLQTRKEAIVANTQTLTNLEKKLDEAKAFEREFDQKKKKYAELVKELQAMQGALPKQFFLPDLLSDILREAKQLELEITSITPDAKESTEELYSSLGFNIEARGTFLQFFIFLDRLAAMKRLVAVSSIRLFREAERPAVTLGGDEGAFAGSKMSGGRQVYPGVRATIRVITYRYKNKTNTGSTGGG